MKTLHNPPDCGCAVGRYPADCDTGGQAHCQAGANNLKAALSTDLLADWRAAITAFGGLGKQLAANAFMPPFAHITGRALVNLLDLADGDENGTRLVDQPVWVFER